MNRDETRRDDGCANAAPYVLGALTEEEHEAFLVHLDTCAVCREEVAALHAVAAALPGAAPQFSAPSTLKRRVMSEVRHDARERAGARERSAQPPRRVFGVRVRPVPALAAGLAAVLAVAIVVASSGGGGGARVVGAHVSAPGAQRFGATQRWARVPQRQRYAPGAAGQGVRALGQTRRRPRSHRCPVHGDRARGRHGGRSRKRVRREGAVGDGGAARWEPRAHARTVDRREPVGALAAGARPSPGATRLVGFVYCSPYG